MGSSSSARWPSAYKIIAPIIIYNGASTVRTLEATSGGRASIRAKSLYRGASSRSRVTEFMSAAVRALEKAGADFGDIRREDRTAFVVRVANEQIQSVNEVHRRGWGIRAFLGGAWGYASGTSGKTADLVQAARKAVAIARGGATAFRAAWTKSAVLPDVPEA